MIDNMIGLRQKYLDAIRALDVEDIENALPSSSYSNFQPLMKGIIAELNKELQEWQESLAFFHNPNDRKECELEAKITEAKIRICERIYLQSFTIEEHHVESAKTQNDNPYNLIFGVNPAGNISFKKDLERDVDRHYYEQISGLLSSLEQGTNLGNVEKGKRLSSSSEKLRGLLEIKGFQLRIIYRELPNNIIYIEMVRVKKDDWSLKDRKEIETRDSLLSKDFERTKKRIKQKDRVEELIIENQQVLSEIREYVEKNTIGRNKNNG